MASLTPKQQFIASYGTAANPAQTGAKGKPLSATYAWRLTAAAQKYPNASRSQLRGHARSTKGEEKLSVIAKIKNLPFDRKEFPKVSKTYHRIYEFDESQQQLMLDSISVLKTRKDYAVFVMISGQSDTESFEYSTDTVSLRQPDKAVVRQLLKGTNGTTGVETVIKKYSLRKMDENVYWSYLLVFVGSL